MWQRQECISTTSWINNQNYEGKPSLDDILGTFISEIRLWLNKNESRLDNIETHVTNMGGYNEKP